MKLNFVAPEIKAVGTYSEKSGRGFHICWSSVVEFVDGQVVRFSGKLSKRAAIKNAVYQVARRAGLSITEAHAVAGV